jgi:hypothetical protein
MAPHDEQAADQEPCAAFRRVAARGGGTPVAGQPGPASQDRIGAHAGLRDAALGAFATHRSLARRLLFLRTMPDLPRSLRNLVLAAVLPVYACVPPLDAPTAPTAPAPASFAPAQPSSADPRLVGCWEDYTASTSSNGSGQFSRTVSFAADGTYVARAFTSISAGDFSSVDEDVEDGRWSAEASTLTFAPKQTAAYQATFELDGGLLIVGGARFVPCT